MRGYLAMLVYYTKIAQHLNPEASGLYTADPDFRDGLYGYLSRFIGKRGWGEA